MVNEKKKQEILRSRILIIKNSLNGKNNKDEKLKILGGLKYLRYYLTLYYAINSSIYERLAKKVGNKRYFNFYKLKNVADSLGLDIDRTRVCKKMFINGEGIAEIEIIREDNRTYISLTKHGEENCVDWIKEVEKIQEHQVLLREANAMKLLLDKGLTDTDRYRNLHKSQLLKLISRIEKISRE